VRPIIVAAVAGALFALGLFVSGMSSPANVIGFLDVTGAWKPTLGFVMAGAIAVHAPIVRIVRRRRSPLHDTKFHWPVRTAIDLPLVIGAMLFGVGWGVSGYCPGTAIASAGSGALSVLVFVGAMLAGIVITRLVRRGN
jgi:uncharacterized membrane protein YedE/YeeE